MLKGTDVCKTEAYIHSLQVDAQQSSLDGRWQGVCQHLCCCIDPAGVAWVLDAVYILQELIAAQSNGPPQAGCFVSPLPFASCAATLHEGCCLNRVIMSPPDRQIHGDCWWHLLH